MTNDIYYSMADGVYQAPYDMDHEQLIFYIKKFRKKMSYDLLMKIVYDHNERYSSSDSRKLRIENICNYIQHIYPNEELNITITKDQFFNLKNNKDYIHILELISETADFNFKLTFEDILSLCDNIKRNQNGMLRRINLEHITNVYAKCLENVVSDFELNKIQLFKIILKYKEHTPHLLKILNAESSSIFLSENQIINSINKIKGQWTKVGDILNSIIPFFENPIFSGDDIYNAETIEDLYNCRSYTITKLLEEDEELEELV